MGRSTESYSPEEKQRITQMGLANKGRHHTPEELLKMRLSHLGKKHTPEEKEKIRQSKLGDRNPNYGKHLSSKTIEKLKVARAGSGNGFYGKHHTVETKVVLSKAASGSNNANFGKPRNDDTVRKIMVSNRVKPNKAELRLQEILNQHFPNEWKFVGDGQVIIGGLCPDFININNRKLLIELYGSYWHSEKQLRNWKSTELGRIMHYNSYGFKCVVIWEKELRDEKPLLAKIGSL